MFFNYAGALQRDAQPQPVNELSLQNHQDGTAPSLATTPDLASQVVQLSKQFDELVANLPHSMPQSNTQLQNIVRLQAQVHEGRKRLEEERCDALQELKAVQSIHGILADDKLGINK